MADSNRLLGGIDSGIYGQVGRPSVALQTPVEALAQVGQAVQAVNANRLFQAQVAAGQAQQQSIDPDTGQPDLAKANRLLAQDPAAAPVMSTILSQNQVLQGQQQALQNNRAAQMNAAVSSVLQLPDAQLHDGTTAALNRLVTQGVVPGFQAAALSQRLDALQDNPAALRSQLQQIQLSSMSPGERQAQIYGTSGVTNSGGYNIPTVTQSPMNGGGRSIVPGAIQQTPGPQFVNNGQKMIPTSGGQQIGSGIQNVTGPETNAALVDVYQPDPNNPGQFIRVKVPRGSLPGASGAAAAPLPGGINPPPGPNPMGTGRGSPSAPVAGSPSAQSADPKAQAAPSQTQSSPADPILAEPPQSAAANNATDIANFQQAKTAIPAVNNTMQNLQHAYDALQTVGTGPSSEAMQRMKSFLVARGLPFPGAADDVKNYDLFRKYTEKYALDQASGSNTDAGRAMMAAANAGTGISTAANNDVLRNEIGKQRLALATVNLAPNQTGIGYGAHAANLSSQVDPRGFSIDMYSPTEVQKMVAAMPNDAARTRFFKAAGIASRLGMVSPRSAAAPAQRTSPATPAAQFTPQVPTSD